MTQAPYFVNRESYYTFGTDEQDFHFSRYWILQVLQPDHMHQIFTWSEELNDLNLNQLESFLLLSIATFHPGTVCINYTFFPIIRHTKGLTQKDDAIQNLGCYLS